MDIINFIRATFSEIREDEAGVTAIEYALIAALVALLLVASLGTLQTAISTAFTSVAAAI